MSTWEPRPAEPFPPGNAVAVKHGAKSERLVKADVDALLATITAAAPPWLEFVDRPSLDAWAYAEATAARLRVWLDEHGHLDGKGKPRAASTLLLQWERRAADSRGRLGFDPLARARLGRDTAVAQAAASSALDQIRATGAQTRAGREHTSGEDE